jgi:hypothetical protein
MFKVVAVMDRPNTDHEFFFYAMGEFQEEMRQAFFDAEGFIDMTIDVEEELHMEASMNFEDVKYAIKFSSIDKNKQLLEERSNLVRLHNNATGHTYENQFRQV